MIAGEMDSATQVGGQSRLEPARLSGREPGDWVPLLLAQLVQAAILLLVRVSTDEFEHADGLVFEVDAGALFQLTDQRGVELLAGALEVIHRATPGGPTGHRQNAAGRGGCFLSWLVLLHQQGSL